MNRVNHIYGDDFGVTMLLIDDTDKLNLNNYAKATTAGGPCGAIACYTPAQLDPEATETNGCTGGILTRTRLVIGQLVGARNFDIGHIGLGINGGGIASLGVVGGDGKARGCTGLPFPTGDFYAIDYVAHEMGHQFSGNHTFNGNQVNCAGDNRNGGTSVEPGSGSSVMAYAGICGADDLQDHTDPYFSQRSLSEMGTYISERARQRERGAVGAAERLRRRRLLPAAVRRPAHAGHHPRHELQRRRHQAGDRVRHRPRHGHRERLLRPDLR